mgnify:CR=1 FL=1
MQKIDLNKLMSFIHKGLYQSSFICILTDEIVVSYLLKDFVPTNTKKKIKMNPSSRIM